MQFPLVFCLLLCLGADLSNTARILGIFYHFGKSHFDFFEPLMKTLAERGHQVVVASYFPQKVPIPNYEDISLKGILPPEVSSTSLIDTDVARYIRRFGNAPLLAAMGAVVCSYVLPSTPIQNLINSDEKFDLIITEMFNADCFLGLVHKFQAPYIAMSSCGLLEHYVDRFGNPDNPSYIPVVGEPASGKMAFPDRLLNTIHYIYYKYFITFFFNLPSEYYARKYFGSSLPPLQDIARNTSLVFVNSHFSITRAVPLAPGVIEVAGLHLQPVKKLPSDLQKFLDSAKQGVIYFSMGSLLKADSLDNDTRQALVDAFSQVPQKVLWKWDGDVLPGQPGNVKISKWVPQFDVLNHPNVKLYIGHGGQLGLVEAAHCGVPMIGIPMFGDQTTNVAHMESTGMGISLNYWGITKEVMVTAIRTVLSDPSYAENAKRVSKDFRDRPMSALDTAVYWTEYTIRHRGARHLRSAAIDMNIIQYLLLDVLLVLLFLTVSVLYIVFNIISRMCCHTFSRTTKIPNSKKTN